VTTPPFEGRLLMRSKDYAKLLEDVEREILLGARSIGILGLTVVTFRILASLTPSGLVSTIGAVYVAKSDGLAEIPLSVPPRPVEALAHNHHDVLVVAADEEKEELLNTALPYVQGTPKVIVAGYGHLKFRDPLFQEELAHLLVPSLANGYPNTLIHLYQCLRNAARLRLSGIVAEFGMFKGGTTMFLSRVIGRLGVFYRQR
jgi:O-methyltransferase